MPTIKLQDTSGDVGAGSRIDEYWHQAGFKEFYKHFRPGKLPANFITIENVEKVMQMYNLKAIGFGHWLNQEDRFNYTAALIVSLHDLNNVLGFGNNIGLNRTLSITFGARGTGSALAHYEPQTAIINITRYHKNINDAFTGRPIKGISKLVKFEKTGGVGSLAHEYGHALDYYFGLYYDQSKDSGALSGGRSVSKISPTKGGELRKAMNAIIDAIIWKDTEGKVYSNYYQRLMKFIEPYNDYWFRRNELFARAFEKYVGYQLSNSGINNKFLAKVKYDQRIYPTDAEIAMIVPKMNKLVRLMAALLTNKRIGQNSEPRNNKIIEI